MISSVVLNGGGKLAKDLRREDLTKAIKSGKKTVWIDVRDPTEEEHTFLKEMLSLHPLTLDDLRQKNEMPKIEVFDNYILAVFHTVDYMPRKREIEMVEIDACLGKNYLVTLHDGEFKSTDILSKRINSNPALMKRGADFLLHAIMDYTIDQYLPLLDSWDAEIEKLEDRIIRGDTEGALEKLVDFRRRVSEMRRSIAPQRHVINTLSRGYMPMVSEKVSVYFRDVYDHISKAYGILESQRDLINSAFQAYSSNASNQMNDVMKTLTLVATIFIPLTFITGIYGMNFVNMPELSHPLGYFIVLMAMFTVGISMVLYFKKRDWM
ncbi:MAG: magnesium and cobalt transport protein CorA [Candidatus Aenigmatarchaeota archaeon]|nr:MAG: magnesium and cobalt transport protein CorA [Candidatus Aenigmarchaeota archaeon]